MTATQPRSHKTAPPKWHYITDYFAPSAGRPPPAAYGVPQLSPPPDVKTLRATDRGVISVINDSIRRNMDVNDYDGEYVGRVKEVYHADFVVRRPWRADIRVPLHQVLAVIDQRVVLAVSGEQAGAP
jgi:hypothetical protein